MGNRSRMENKSVRLLYASLDSLFDNIDQVTKLEKPAGKENSGVACEAELVGHRNTCTLGDLDLDRCGWLAHGSGAVPSGKRSTRP